MNIELFDIWIDVLSACHLTNKSWCNKKTTTVFLSGCRLAVTGNTENIWTIGYNLRSLSTIHIDPKQPNNKTERFTKELEINKPNLVLILMNEAIICFEIIYIASYFFRDHTNRQTLILWEKWKDFIRPEIIWSISLEQDSLIAAVKLIITISGFGRAAAILLFY